MSELLALASAAMFGLGDFTGGLITRRTSVWTVMLWSQVCGVAVLAVGFLTVSAPAVRVADIAYGAAAGTAGLAGLVILYTALARGTMSVVAPVTAATGAGLPVVFDLVTGDRLSPEQWLGIALGIAAVALLGLDPATRRLDSRSLLPALAAGSAFAVFFIAFAQTEQDAGLWPLAAARAASIPIAAVIAVGLGRARPPRGTPARLVATAGTLDMAANVSILLALQRGSLAVSTVLSSLYPAFTAIAAVVLLRERPRLGQGAGVLLAVAAVIALSL